MTAFACAMATFTAMPAAHATATLVDCTGGETDTYTPAVGLFPHPTQVTIDGDPGSCTGVVNSAAYDENFAFPSGHCETLLLDSGSGTLTRIFTWDNGTTSTFSYSLTVTTTPVDTVSVLTGTITAGRFSGDTAVQTTAYPHTAILACLTTGLASASGTSTLLITSL